MTDIKPVLVPSLTDAFSRRRAIMRVATLATAPAGALPALAAPSRLDPADARLMHLVDTYEALERAVDALPSEAPEFGALVSRYSDIETEIADI